jgi:mannose-1-phosphate guanylyltransferase
MKAVLLAAGVGSRMRPLTDAVPKCMLPIDGQPLLDIWLDAFERAGVDEVLINLHHLPAVVCSYLHGRNAGPAVHTVFEPELLGSAGTLVANRDWLGGDDAFLVCNADNLTDLDLRWFISGHLADGAVATVALFRSEEPWRCGIVELDQERTVVGFVEKPAQPAGNLANAGVYAFHPGVMDGIGGPFPKDIGYDLLPLLVGRAKGVLVDGYFRDIGTPDSYGLAQAEWSERRVRPVGC